MADPTIDNQLGTITLDMDDGDSNYTLSKSKMTTVLDEASAMILIPQDYTKYDQFEDTDFTNWYYDDFTATRSTADEFIDDYAAEVPGGSQADLMMMRASFGTSPVPAVKLVTMYFRLDNNSSGDNTTNMFTLSRQNKTPVAAYGLMSFGLDGSEMDYNTWIYKIDAGSNQSAGAADTNWHKLTMGTTYSLGLERSTTGRKIYLDNLAKVNESASYGGTGTIDGITLSGTDPVEVSLSSEPFWETGDEIFFEDIVGTTEMNEQEYVVTKVDSTTFTLDGTDSSGFTAWVSDGTGVPQDGFTYDYRTVFWGQYDSGTTQINMDEFVTENTASVYDEGTAIIEAQPTLAVHSFDSVTIDDDTATSPFHGTTTYEFQHSTDGGSSYGSLTDLTNVNLQALALIGQGLDSLKITITHTPDTTAPWNTVVPRTNSVVINFTPFKGMLPLMGMG